MGSSAPGGQDHQPSSEWHQESNVVLSLVGSPGATEALEGEASKET
jgi:hypothetical protein